MVPEEVKGICLDLGCGRGIHRLGLEKGGFKWIGIDIIDFSHSSAIADAHALPFAENVFDLVFISQVLEHLPYPWKAFHEVYRVLKLGGLFCGSVVYVEPWSDSFFHFSHWGVERILKDSDFVIRKIKRGANLFLMVAHFMLDGPGINIATPFVQIFIQPIIRLWKTAVQVYIQLKFGRQSGMYQKLLRYFETLPYRLLLG